jgi:hypothetical protein
MEKISWTDRVRNEEGKEERNILHKMKKKVGQLDWSILRKRCLLNTL